MLNPFRESGLPSLTSDQGGEHGRYGFAKGVVRAIYPDLWRVDIEPEEGGLLKQALVVGDVLPPVHSDTTQPSHVMFTHIRGHAMDVVCWPLPFRRMFGPETADTGHDRHFYQKNRQIVRVGNLTVRITPDDAIYIYDAETNDYCLYDMPSRTFHVIGPHVFLGTDEADRIELHTGTPLTDEVRIRIPKALIGGTALEDSDGITYKVGEIIHLVSDLIKLSANTIVLDPVDIRIGHENATERLVLGDLFMTFLNTFLSLFNSHQHSGVQTGAGTSGVPTVATPAMTSALLSDVAHVSKTGL